MREHNDGCHRRPFETMASRIREAPKGTRVFMRSDDVFKDADVHGLDELWAARLAAVVREDEDEEEKLRR
jgi:hypothetical protein